MQGEAKGFTSSNSEDEKLLQNLEEQFDDSPQFTWRVVIVGCLLGTLISASNFYVGLKMGWTFGAGIFGSIFGYSIIKVLERNGFGGLFTAKEHATLSSVATAAGSGTLAGYISGIPAMYRLGLLSNVQADLWRVMLWSLAASLYGIFFAIPLRKWFVIKQKLPFPSPTATAEIIKSLHGTGGAAIAAKKTKAMLITFGLSIVYLIFAYFIPIMKSWRIFYWLSEAFPRGTANHWNLMEADKWSWCITLSWAFIGAGMMTPMNTHISANAGSVLAWGILGPLVMAWGIAPGDRHQMKGTMVHGKLIGVTELPTARYWLLWPGLVMMMTASFSELACNWRMLMNGITSALASAASRIKRRGKDSVPVPTEDYDDQDPVPLHQQVPASWWIPGLVASIVLSVIVMKTAFGVGIGESLFAILLGFIFAFVGLQSSGETDINPTGTIAKASQIIFSSLPPYNPNKSQLMAKQTANLTAGLVSASAASQSVDMVSDLKTGHLVGASPRSQFLGQLVGSVAGAVFGLVFWVLFTSAYPCIVSPAFEADEQCREAGFGLQAVTAWQGITMALTQNNSIPPSSLYFALGMGLFTICVTIIKSNLVPKPYHCYLPNMNAVGIAFVNTDPSMFIAMLIGGIASRIWKGKRPEQHELYMYAIASGLIAGEGVFGLIQAALSISHVPEGAITRFGMPLRPRLHH